MFRPLALLTSILLMGMALLVPLQHSAAQSDTVEATMAATEPAIQIQDGLTLDSNYFETDTANPKLSIKLREPVLVGKASTAVTGFNKASDDIIQDISGSFKKD